MLYRNKESVKGSLNIYFCYYFCFVRAKNSERLTCWYKIARNLLNKVTVHLVIFQHCKWQLEKTNWSNWFIWSVDLVMLNLRCVCELWLCGLFCRVSLWVSVTSTDVCCVSRRRSSPHDSRKWSWARLINLRSPLASGTSLSSTSTLRARYLSVNVCGRVLWKDK